MTPTFFSKQSDFRKWLIKNHSNKKELLVGFYKVGSSKPSMTWSQSVDEALCFGWIDGVRKSIDEESYSIRFTPRKPSSIWSSINIKKVEVLTKKGLMQPAGVASFKLRQEHKSSIYSYEKEAIQLSPAFKKKFKANKKAWAFFTTQAPFLSKSYCTSHYDSETRKNSIGKIGKSNHGKRTTKKIDIVFIIIRVVSFYATINFGGVVANPADQQGILQRKNIAEQLRCRQLKYFYN